MSHYATLLLAPKPGRTGDALAEEFLFHQDTSIPMVGKLVPRSEAGVYQHAVDSARRSAVAAGYRFKVIDPADAKVEVGIPKSKFFVHRVERYVRVARLERRRVLTV
jgi:hypothetical protein